ncbi:MAG: DUF6502 family protein [Gammaproteobacteria bacterium]
MNSEVRNSCRSIFVQVAIFFGRFGLNFQDLQQILKEAVVEAAAIEGDDGSEKISDASIASKVGLSRKVVAELRRKEAETILQTEESLPEGMILREWHQNPLFCDQDGAPAELSIVAESRGIDFEELVRKTGDVRPVDEILRTLLDSGDVEKTESGRAVRVLKRAYIMQSSDQSVIRYFGIAASNLLATLVHNTAKGTNHSPYFERTTWVSGIRPGTFARFSELVAETSIPFLEILDDWLSSRKANEDAVLPNTESASVVGFGIYVFDRK